MNEHSPSRSVRSLRWIADRNPFYLLSACCGLVGCWLLGDVAGADLTGIAMRIAGLLVYQVVVVDLALWLANRRGTHRDAAILSVLTLVMAADFSFFFTQSAMLSVASASLFTLFGAAQSLGIVGILLGGLQVRMTKPAQWLLGVDLVAVHVLPLVIRLSTLNGLVTPLPFMCAFAAAGALLAIHAWPAQWRTDKPESNAPTAAQSTLGRGMALAAPTVALTSFITHAFAIAWVYDIRFITVFLSPLCLGAAALCLRLEARRVETLTRISPDEPVISACSPGGAAAGLAMLGAFFAVGNPIQTAVWNIDGASWLGVSPLRLTLLAATAIFVGLWRLWRVDGTLILAAGAAMLAGLGHTPQVMFQHLVNVARTIDILLYLALPTSRIGWGAFLFTAAFLSLGAGACLSWWKNRTDPEGPEVNKDTEKQSHPEGVLGG